MSSNDGTGRGYNVLFLCTGNSARSILGEAILNHVGGGRFRAFSAGSRPAGQVNPYAIDLARQLGYRTAGLRSKSWDEFDGPDAPPMDFVFTVCDNAARESCPIWPGHPMTANWSLPDPAAVEGSDAQKRAAFADTHRQLSNRIALFVSLPFEKLDQLALREQVRRIGAGDPVESR